MSTQAAPPFNINEATQRAAQVVLWVHSLLNNESASIETKSHAISKAILYLSRLSRLSDRAVLLPSWMEPLWNAWQVAASKRPPRHLTAEQMAEAASRDVNIAYDPISLDTPYEDASTALGPDLLGLMAEYPLRPSRPPPAPTNPLPSEDVSMDNAPDMDTVGSAETMSSTPPKTDENDEEYPFTDDGQRAGSSESSRARTSISRRGSRASRGKTTKATAEVPTEVMTTRQAAVKGKIAVLLADPGFRHRVIDIGGAGACDRCLKKKSLCYIPLPGATVAGVEIGWNACGLCHTGKAGCSLTASSAKGESGSDIVSQVGSRGDPQPADKKSRPSAVPPAVLNNRPHEATAIHVTARPVSATPAVANSRPASASYDSYDEEDPYPSLRTLNKKQAGTMIALVEQVVNASEKKVTAKLEQQHKAALKEIAELRQQMVAKNDAIAVSIQALSRMFGMNPTEGSASFQSPL